MERALAAARRTLDQAGLVGAADPDEAGAGGGAAGAAGAGTAASAPSASGTDIDSGAGASPDDGSASAPGMPMPEAEVHARRLLDYLGRAPGIETVEMAGEFRRRCPSLTGLHVLAVGARPGPITRYLTTYADAASAAATDMSRGSLVLNCGLAVELRVVPRRSHGAALHHLTGSHRYTDAIRAFGLGRHVRISEYGVFGLEEGRAGARRLGGHDEADIFDALGLPWIPPELREDTGEIEAARDGRLPVPVGPDDVRGDVFATVRSSGSDTAEEVARGCRDHGRDWCIICDAWLTTRAPGLSPATLREQVAELDRLRRAVTGMRIVHAVAVDLGVAADGNALPALGSFEAVTGDVRDRVDLVVGILPELLSAGAAVMQAVAGAVRHGRLDVLAVPPEPPLATAGGTGWEDVLVAMASVDAALLITGSSHGLEGAAAHARRARDAGVRVLLASGARVASSPETMRHLVDQARRGWLDGRHMVNAIDTVQLLHWLRARRRAHR